MFFEPLWTRLKEPFAVNDSSVRVSQQFRPSAYSAYSVVFDSRRFLTPDEDLLSFECPAISFKSIAVLQSMKIYSWIYILVKFTKNSLTTSINIKIWKNFLKIYMRFCTHEHFSPFDEHAYSLFRFGPTACYRNRILLFVI